MKLKKSLFLIGFGLVVGSLVGILEVIFGKGLLMIIGWRQVFFFPLIFGLPFAGLLIEWLYSRFGGRSRQGMGLVFDVGLGEQKSIPFRLIPIVIVSTWLTHLFGGSAGREGVAVQIGATLSHWIERLNPFKNLELNLTKIALVTGMAAGFSGLFQVPIAAIFFAIEIFIAGKLDYESLLSASVASFTAFYVSKFLGLEKFSYHLVQMPELNFSLLLKLLVLGFLFGIVGFLFAIALKQGKVWTAQLLPNRYVRIFCGGILLVGLLILFHAGRYSGLGSELVTLALNGGKIYSYDFLLKIILTVLTLSIGFQGGEVTPLFTIGCTFGVVIAPLFGLPVTFVAALGYASVFGSATNTFLAPIFLAGEVFGFELTPYIFIIMCIAYHCNFSLSIYGKQKSLVVKS
ncbi:chloride channel protein [Vagococcus sp.]|uniref:chloride channel protein n=1 Tax=Vagococcus sp. TaxID=1933889 RepID=UPI003F94DBA8